MENMNNDNQKFSDDVTVHTPDRRMADFYREKAMFYTQKWLEAENLALRQLVNDQPEWNDNVVFLMTGENK